MLLIFDCNYVCWTCAYALSKGNMEYKGSPTGIIFGFMKQLIFLLENFEPDQIAFCWDSREYKRKEIYPDYKKKDPLTKEEEASRAVVYAQFEAVRTVVLSSLGFSNIFRMNGYESDDLIAKYVIEKKCNPEQTIIITRDQDLYQLLDFCSLYCIQKMQTTNREIFLRHYGIPPGSWSQVKAIAGCSSDKVQGVFGIGDKKAVAYIKKELKGKMLARVLESQDIIDRNMKLVKLPFPGTPTMNLSRNRLNVARFTGVCDSYGMESLIDKKTISRWMKIISRIL